jgi:hypothetical protein
MRLPHFVFGRMYRELEKDLREVHNGTGMLEKD